MFEFSDYIFSLEVVNTKRVPARLCLAVTDGWDNRVITSAIVPSVIDGQHLYSWAMALFADRDNDSFVFDYAIEYARKVSVEYYSEEHFRKGFLLWLSVYG